VPGGDLDVTKRHPGAKRGGNETIPKAMRTNVFCHTGRPASRRTIRVAACRLSGSPPS
jgi:hypothetical protein